LFVKVREAAAGDSMAIVAWDNIPQGAVVLSLTGEIVFTNRAAAKYFESGPLRINKDGTLSLGNDVADRDLRTLLNGMLHAAVDTHGSFGGSILARQNSRPLIVSVSPFEVQGAIGLVRKYALVLINDPSTGENASESFLHKNYRLTAAEIRLALLLARGNSLKEAAEELGITHNTARTHLKRIFGKTAVNRQSSLVRLILARETRSRDL
jgi:DNA-binding CsgD family transcriptional regulator